MAMAAPTRAVKNIQRDGYPLHQQCKNKILRYNSAVSMLQRKMMMHYILYSRMNYALKSFQAIQRFCGRLLVFSRYLVVVARASD